MEEKNLIEKMHKILGVVGKEYVDIPQPLKETFDNLIRQRLLNPIEFNNAQPKIMIEEDDMGELLLSYINENGDKLQVLSKDIKYKGLDDGIKIQSSTFFYEFERVYERIKKEIIEKIEKNQEGFLEEQKELLEKQAIERLRQPPDYDKIVEYADKLAESSKKLAEYSKMFSEQLASVKTSDEYLDIMLSNYAEYLKEKSVYKMTCEVAEGIGVPKGPRRKVKPIGNPKEEFNLEHRIEGIEKIIPNNELIVINDGEYYAYTYDLSQNENDEKGYMIIVEPKQNEGIATRVIYLSEEEFEELKEKEQNKDATDIEVKAMYLKEILEDRDKLEQMSRINHRNYGKWLAIMNYYLKGNKEIDLEILNIINEGENITEFHRRFPREYLRKERLTLLEGKGER